MRLHIGLFGRRNVGKSSLLNALSGQNAALVSPTPGTTTDPVEKVMEMPPLGPVVFVDTAGLDDAGELGRLRVERSLQALARVDVALLITDGPWGTAEEDAVRLLRARHIPFMVVCNKADTDADLPEGMAATLQDSPCIRASALSGQGLDAIRKALADLAGRAADSAQAAPLLADLLPSQGLALLVTPIDTGAPRGRLIMPQVQAIRDCLDNGRLCMVVTEARLSAALASLGKAPDLLVCDSQVVQAVAHAIPQSLPMTTFSILMARLKGDLSALVRGAAALTRLAPGDAVLIQEACSHHPQKDDIGRVKLPRLLEKLAGGPLRFSWHGGRDFSAYDADCKAIVHCGGCVMTRRQMLVRQGAAAESCIPMTNYGLAISLAQGVLRRALQPFPYALRAFEEAESLTASHERFMMEELKK